MNKLIAVALLATLGLAQQQESAAEKAPSARRLVELKYLSGPRADRAAELIRQFMHPVGRISIDSQLKSAVLVGPAEVVTSAEALLRKFDIPETDRSGAQVTFALHLIEASSDEGSRGNPIPKVIEPAVDQMRKAFLYKSYRWMDTLLLVGRGSGGASASGMLPLKNESGDRASYEAAYNSLEVFENTKTVAVRGFRFRVVMPQNRAPASIASDLTINYGQKLVIGKLSADQPSNAIFLVLTVEIQ